MQIEDVAGAVKDLIQAVKVKHFGLSEAAAQMIRRAHADHPVTAVQSEYSLWRRRPEEEILPLLGARHRLCALQPTWEWLPHGQINEQTRFADSDLRSRIPRFSAAARKANQALVARLEKGAQRRKATPGQIALAWLPGERPWIVPIPGTTKLGRVEKNMRAAGIALTAEDLRELSLRK